MSMRALRIRALAVERRVQHVLQRSYERRLGIETTDAVDLRDLGVAGEGRADYYAAPAFALRAALRRLRPSRRDVLVDLGAGKGKAVIVAAQLPFAKVIGVELADDLTTIARANVERVRRRLRCQDVELVTADATSWPIPGDVSVTYMYCPFMGAVFDAAMERVFESFDSYPRPLFIVYGYPWEHNRLTRTGRVKTVDVNPARWPRRPGWGDSDHTFVTYQVTAPDGSTPERPVAGGGFGWRAAMEHWSRANDVTFVHYPPGGGPPLRSEES
jgi:Methyltransferase domain